MNKAEEMKKIIKPLVKECIKEILYEEGMMKIMQENVQKQERVIAREVPQENYDVKEREFMKKNAPNTKVSLQEAKKKLLQEIGMSGFDPFAGSHPLPQDPSNQLHEEGVQEGRLMQGIQGSGVDISGLMSANKQSWNFYNKALNKSKKE